MFLSPPSFSCSSFYLFPAIKVREGEVSPILCLANNRAKEVGLAAWLQCWLSILGVAGSSPGHDNF